ncbi:MAG TPA: hypothetical protein VEA99_05310 [Gemmatimonadaceae bacterium]|nr:hypothetical protein [Gemmatimonadaceae bacterium]
MKLMQGVALLALATTTACASGTGGGGLGDILGSVLGSGAGSQVSGTIQGVDTRNRQVVITTSNNQTAYLGYDDRTRVVYQDRAYDVTALERGDRVTARVQQSGNAYYTDQIEVTQSVSSGGSTTRELVAISGIVRQVNHSEGWFYVEQSNGGTVTISMPYNVTRTDDDRFRSLRVGNSVRVYALPITNTRAEFRQFY